MTGSPSIYTMNHPDLIVYSFMENSIGLKRVKTRNYLLIDFSLTVKAATLIFISGRGSAIASAKQGQSGSIYNLVKFGPCKRACI